MPTLERASLSLGSNNWSVAGATLWMYLADVACGGIGSLGDITVETFSECELFDISESAGPKPRRLSATVGTGIGTGGFTFIVRNVGDVDTALSYQVLNDR